MPARYAIYYAPAADEALWRLGSSLLGYDAASGREIEPPPGWRWNPADWHALTEEPRRYGFHATLKAPFGLADGLAEPALLSAVEAFAAARPPIADFRLRVGLLGAFVALVPSGDAVELHDLADACTRDLDSLRAPLSEADRARRLMSLLTERQIAQLDAYGYPYVFEDFRFHMTLTGALPKELREPVRAALDDLVRPILAPIALEALSIFRQDDRGGRFRIVARFPVGG